MLTISEFKRQKRKKVRFLLTTVYERDLPEDWDDSMLLFWANDGSWCVNNAFDDLSEMDNDCGCGRTVMELSTPSKEIELFGYEVNLEAEQ